MSKYTLELYELLDEGVNVFDFEYDFYTDDIEIRKAWEKKFIDKYLFYEIGFCTVFKFKHYLKEKLNRIAPYYKQLYETEIKSRDIEFLLNKDLKEEFIREVEATKETTDNSVNDITSEYSGNTLTTDNNKESNIPNGNASINLEQGYLTGVEQNINDVEDSNTTDSTSSIESTGTEDNNLKETTTLISKGNIGVTSSAQLLKEWRQVLINIDELIINECKDLFMMIM